MAATSSAIANPARVASSRPPRSPWWAVRNWPRERRDTLFLLVTLSFIVAPHTAYLPVWASIFVLLALVWRARLAWRAAPLPGTPTKVLLLLVAVGLTLAGFRTIAGPEAGGTLLVLLVALKTLELRARRDALVIFYLGFLLILMSFFQSQGILVALAMLVAVTALLTALVNAHMPAGKPSLSVALATALKLMAFGLPIMAVLFVTFPRIGPLWGTPQLQARTGLSEDLHIGDINTLAKDEAIAMRVRFDGQAPAPRDLYFRGPVLERFDGVTWRSRGYAPMTTAAGAISVQGRGIDYEVTLEPNRQPWLMPLDFTPPETPPQLDAVNAPPPRMRADLQWVMNRPVTDRLRYRARAYVRYAAGVNAEPALLAADIALPPGSNPRTLAWVRRLDQEPAFRGLDARGKASRLLDHLRSGAYRYTLSPAAYAPANAADQLWFDRKEGFCEHYAMAFAVAMRALGIPARIVTGYQGAERNPVDGYWTIRQSNAHAWVEIWQDGSGWLRVDPTAAIDPGRVDGSAPVAVPPGLVDETFGRVAPTILSRLRLHWDAMENSWNQWVISYSQTRQLDLMRTVRESLAGLATSGWLTGLGIAAAILISLAVIRWRRPQRDRWQSTYQLLRDKLSRAGVMSDASTGPRTLARLAARSAPESTSMRAAVELLLRLERWRYAPGQDARELTAIMHATRQLKLS